MPPPKPVDFNYTPPPPNILSHSMPSHSLTLRHSCFSHPSPKHLTRSLPLQSPPQSTPSTCDPPPPLSPFPPLPVHSRRCRLPQPSLGPCCCSGRCSLHPSLPSLVCLRVYFNPWQHNANAFAGINRFVPCMKDAPVCFPPNFNALFKHFAMLSC